MKYKLHLLISVITLLLKQINGFGSGAPPSKCDSMFPSHNGMQPENNLPPYTLTVSTDTYRPGQTITVTLSSPAGAAFKGYIIAAKDQATLKTIQGRFINSATGKVLPCGEGAGAVTHTSRNSEYSLQFQWQPTGNTYVPVVFIGTVLESYSVFWLNIVTAPVTLEVVTIAPVVTTQAAVVTTTVKQEETTTEVMTTKQPTTKTTTKQPLTTSTKAPKPPVTSLLTHDKDCGFTKGCFIDCTGNTCNYVVTWKDNGNAVNFEISMVLGNTNNKWIGIAFSDDLKMGSDEVVACFNIEGSTSIERSYNEGRNNRKVDDRQAGLSNKVVAVANGIISCSFTKNKRLTRQKRQTSNDLYVNLDNDYFVMLGTGGASKDREGKNAVGYHPKTPDVTPKKVHFQSVEVIGDTAKYPLVKMHACLMIIAWIFCTGVGIITARYYKPVWSKASLFDQKVWFQIHRTLMVTATTLTVVAFIIIFVEVGGYSEISSRPGKEYLPSHPVLGILVTILSLLNPIMSLFRPGPTDKNRPIFNWAHWGVGMVAQILAIITIIFGVELQKSTAPKYTVWVVVGFVIYYVIMEIVQRVIDKLAERKDEGQVDAVEMKQNGASNGSSYSMSQPVTENTKDKKDTLLKKSLLALHAICTLAFTLTLLLLVSMY